MMRNNCPGFSLIEMAIVLIILGILATVLIPPLVSSVKYEKRAENKDALNALKLSILGYAKAKKGILPGSSDSLNGTGLPTKDIWGRLYKYKKVVDGSVCKPTPTTNPFDLKDNVTVNNVAFAVASHSRRNGGEDDAQYNSTSWDFSGDGHDDIYEFVTLPQLKYFACAATSSTNSTGDDSVNSTESNNDIVSGDYTVAKKTTIIGDLVVDGTVTIEDNAKVTGNVAASGNVKIEIKGNNESYVVGGNIISSGNVVISSNQDDVVVANGNVEAAGNVVIEGTVEGDVVAGGSVTISGTVNGNVYAGGSVVIYSGTVNESVYTGGSIVVYSGEIVEEQVPYSSPSRTPRSVSEFGL